MVYYEVNFDDDNDSLCLANNHANFVIWKPQVYRSVLACYGRVDHSMLYPLQKQPAFVKRPCLVLNAVFDSRFKPKFLFISRGSFL